jgi:TonB family protein
LRRELGKLLFSGPYSPSTFNLAYFLNDLFRDEIEAETRARNRELSAANPPAAGTVRPAPTRSLPPAPPGAAPVAARPPRPAPPARKSRSDSRRKPLAWIGTLAAAAIAGGIFVISRRSDRAPGPGFASRRGAPAPTATFLPEFVATPAEPTDTMSEAQFRDEVSRRLAREVQKLQAQMQTRATSARAQGDRAPTAFQAIPAAALAVPTPSPPVPEPTLPPTPPPALARIAPTASAAPTRVLFLEGSLIALEDADSPPRIATIVKPSYPPLALKARIGGIVVLRVLVSENGIPLDVEVMRSAGAGLTEAAVEAVRKWTFDPARKSGLAMRTWMVIPIPFEP